MSVISSAAAGTLVVASLFMQVDRWARDDTTQEQFMADRFACLQTLTPTTLPTGSAWAPGRVVVSQALFRNCMAAKGYRRDKKGPLVVPKDLVVPMG